MGKGKRIKAYGKNVNGRDLIIMILEDISATAVVAWLFYDSIWGCLVFPLIGFVNYKRIKDNRQKNYSMKFNGEFKELLLCVAQALQSGYSVENAFKDAEDNINMLYGKKSIILKDIKEMNMKISMRTSAEKAFESFAIKHPTEEVIGFSEIFSFGRRLGGDYIKNMKRTIEKMEDKLDLRQELSTSIAEKQMELRVMCGMPFFIILYIRISSGEFISSLYHNITGAIVMSGCLVAYVFFVALGRKIVNIEV